MGWTGSSPNKTFTRTDGTYTGATVFAQEKAAGAGIVETNLDAEAYDMAQGLNAALLKDGGNKPTALIDAGGYGFTNMAVLGSATEATLASSTTTDLLGSTALFNSITGTTTITGLGTGATRLKVARFTGALTLTHNSSSLILPGGANITTAAGDTMVVVSDGSSNARVLAYQPAANAPGVPNDASVTLAKMATMATASFIGRNTSGTGAPEVLSAATARGTIGLATGTITAIIDGGGAVITAGRKGYIGPFDFAGTITGVVLLGDQSGSIVVDLYKTTYTAFDASSTHPVSGDKITASAPPTLSSVTKSKDTTLTGWTTSFAVDDLIEMVVTGSPASVTRVTLKLTYTR